MADENKPINPKEDFTGAFGQQTYTFGTDPDADKRNGFEPTGVENISVDNNPAPTKPDTWQEAVDEHFSATPAEPKFGNNQDVIDFLVEERDKHKLPTEEDLKKEKRRQRTEGIINGIADGVRAFSNLIFTTQYAPNTESNGALMTDKMRERHDKLKAERQADADRFLNYSLMIGKLKNEHEAMQYQRGRDALADQIRQSQEDRAQAKADRDAAMADLKMQLLSGKITEQEAAARSKEIESEYAEAYWQSRIDKNNRYQPSQGRSGGGKPAEYAWRDKDGNLHYVHSEAAARNQAAQHGGTYVTTPKSTTRSYQDRYGRNKTESKTEDVSTPKGTIGW